MPLRRSDPVWEAVPSNDTSDSLNFPSSPAQPESHYDRLNLPSNWPTEPRHLSRLSLVSILMDLLCLVVIAPFGVLLYACYNASGKMVNKEYQEAIYQGLSVSATAYPLLFSACIGRLLKRIAAYQLERGSSIQILELLSGSSTLVNTIRTCVSLRSAHMLGISLVFLWSISPLGGQSPLHAIKTERMSLSSSFDLKYFNTTSPGQRAFTGADHADTTIAVDAVYSTSILAPQTVKESSMDVWGNVKIPSFRAIPGSQNATGWVYVPNDTSAVEYSSLIGVPIMGLSKQGGNVTFPLISTYFDFILDDSSKITTLPFVLNGSGFRTSYAYFGNATPMNMSVEEYASSGRLLILPNMMSGLLYLKMYQVYVESTVHCTLTLAAQHTCRVTAMRNITPSQPVAYNLTQWGDHTMDNTLSNFNWTMGTSNPLSEAYLRAPNDPLAINLTQPFNSSTVASREAITIRFGQLFNTYAFSVADPAGILQSSSPYVITTRAQYIYQEPTERIVVDWVWMTIFSAAVFILILAAFGTLGLNVMTLNPEILGSVSVTTWKSPYVDVPDTGSFLNGQERTRLLKNIVIRLGDVQSWDPVAGKLAIGTEDRIIHIAKERLYQ
ncbi:hypothetical protein BJX99DRAFT_260927 [Aspergillus californicus]